MNELVATEAPTDGRLARLAIAPTLVDRDFRLIAGATVVVVAGAGLVTGAYRRLDRCTTEGD